MSSNIQKRYFWLINIIYRYKQITLKEINQQWLSSSLSNGLPIPRKTFNNHRNAIEELFEINIDCDKVTNRYSISNLSDIEQNALSFWLLNGFAISNTINESKSLKERIIFENIPSCENHLISIIDIMKRNKMIRLSYQSFWDEDSYEVEIEPYCLKVFKQRWYLLAKTDKIKIFALDRIEYLTELPNEFILPADFDAEIYFADCYGIINNNSIKPEKICLRFEINQANYIRSLPLHKTQKELKNTDNTVEFEYFLKPTYDFLQEILKYGEFVEVVKPEWLRNEFKQKIEKMANRYQN